MSEQNKIHVAFGFHVNCYHSYRGDTPDGLGFGSDIRIIRQIIRVLNELNESGIPVKGTWDFENFFSLEKILPEYAPDIIEGVKERVEKHGDENIIMGYSNGALSAMTDDEFTASIELAVTNPGGSGLRDIFGKCEMIVRPQEVMFTPSQVSLYNKCGVKALCLYYSCVPFDAFRTVIPPLPDEQAFNPLTYTYKGESMTVIPTYNNSDICDAGCMRKWVKDLRRKQVSGEINRDLFVFVNMDADAIFWETMKIPVIGSRIANTDGIHGLVSEIADLDYVVFDTPGGYIANHSNAGEISFTQDTADGNFTGYASWAEKPYNRKIWTALERARAMSKITAESDRESPSFADRVLLLSTTHFGLATPVLNIQREEKANALAESVVSLEKNALPESEKITLHNINGSVLQCLQIKTKAVNPVISGEGLVSYTAVEADDGESIFAVMKFSDVKPEYIIEITDGEAGKADDSLELSTPSAVMKFNAGGISEIIYGGKTAGDKNFLSSFINYGGKKYPFSVNSVKPLAVSGNGKCVKMSGGIHLPGEIKGGRFKYLFFTCEGVDMIFVRASVSYPYTPENDSISTENSTLGRFTDMKWTEAAPFALSPLTGKYPKVIKRNYSGDISEFSTSAFPESDPKNTSLASFNHQLTAGLTAVSGNGLKFVLSNQRQVLNSMAHCPMRLEKDGTVIMNPFGHFYGPQRHHWGRGGDEILGVYTLVTPQGKSIAPSYNGVTETAFLAMSFKDESDCDYSCACAFADGAVLTAPDGSDVNAFYGDNVRFSKTVMTGESGENLRNPVFSGLKGNAGKYITKGSKAIFHIISAQIKSKR